MIKLIPKNQTGGPLKYDQVVTGTDKYNEAYKNRSLGRNNISNGTFDLAQDLPEVTIQGKDERVLDYMQKVRAKFASESLNLLSHPQKLMMQGLSGKYQSPSEAWGFKQP